MKIFLVAIFSILSFNLYAQTVKSINFEGMVHISKPVALRMLEFTSGDNVDSEILNKSLIKYYNQGYFTDVWIDITDGALTYHFAEKPVISKVELDGWKENDEDALENIVKIKHGSLYDKKKLDAAKKRIIEAISQDAKIDSVVEIKEEYLDNGSVKITFVVNEGEEIIIKKLQYSGANKLDSDEFDEVIANKEKDFMGWLWGRNDGEMKLADLDYDPLRIRDYYMQHGYLDASVDKPFVKVDFNNYTADMSYQIKEGVSYKINKISIEQTKEVIEEEKVLDILKLTIGDTFNIKTFREDSTRIKTLVSDLSYAFVQVTPDLKKNKKDGTVEVVFKIIPGEKVMIRNVIISGNKRTLDRVIRREIFLGPGDMYSLTDLSDSRSALGRLGYFEANTIEQRRVNSNTVDLIVKVKEAPTGNIQLAGGYGSSNGLLISLAVNDRNVFGSGINVGVTTERSEISSNHAFNISNPRLNDTDFSGNFSIFKSDYEHNDYTVLSNGIGLGLGNRFTRHINGTAHYGYSKNAYNGIKDANITAEQRQFYQDYVKSSITLSVRYDDTDDYYLPRKGISASQSVEYAGLGGVAEFIKNKTTFSAYKGLEEYLGFDIIARYKARFYNISKNDNLPIAERFYMGGIGSIRGYESYSLAPYYKNNKGEIVRIGGEYTASNSLELSFPLVPKAKMRLVAFVDYGAIGGISGYAKISNQDTINDDLITRGGYGMGLEWFSPVGPIQLIFGRALNEEKDDKISNFEFSMGQRF
jgi:outer membrane protein insertion porin family